MTPPSPDDSPSRFTDLLDTVRRFVTRRRGWTAAIAAGVVAVLVLVLVLTLGGSGGSPKPSPTGALPTPSTSSSSSSSSTTVSGKPAVPSSGAYLGVYAAPHATTSIGSGGANGGSSDVTGAAIATLQQQTGTPFAIDHRYYRWDQPFSVDLMRQTAAKGRIPFLAFQTANQSGRKITYADIANGNEDASLEARADAAKAFGKPMFVSFDHEPNARIGKSGTAEEYVAAWRHIVTLFRQRGATNVAFVYVQTASSFRQDSPLDEKLYPGDDYIDWLGADGYNFAGCPGKQASWTSFKQIFNSFYAWGTAKHKPMMVSELGVSEDPSDAARKGEWYRQVGQQIGDFPQIKAVVYYNAAPLCANYVDTSQESLAGFQALVKDPYFITSSSG